jgi:putative ABC transport system permease protein
MQIIRLAIKIIRGNGFRSLAIFLAVAGVAGFLLTMTLIIAGAQHSLDSSLKRLGADILVVPKGAETKVGTSLLMGKPINPTTPIWMPRENIQKVAAIPGVEVASPQVYLASMYDSPCCSLSEMFIVVFDPETDFTITPWLKNHLHRGLSKGEVVGGTYIFVPEGWENIRLYGYDVNLVGNLEPTGTGIDKTLFMTMDTAVDMGKASLTRAVRPAYVRRGADPSSYEFSFQKNISAILVKVAPGVDVHRVALQIAENTDGMVPIESPQLFGAFRSQMNGLLWGFFAITLIVWAVAVILIGVVFSMAANERRREMAVLRAVGATRNFVFRSVLTEAALLALSGAIVGIAAAASGLFIFKDAIAGSLKMPFLFPSLPSFIGLFGAGVALAIISVALSAMIPAIRLSRQELAIAMRE